MTEPQAAEQSPAAPATSGTAAASSPPAVSTPSSTSNGSIRLIAWAIGLGLTLIAVAIIITGSMLRNAPVAGSTSSAKQAGASAQQTPPTAPPAEDPNALVIVRRDALGESTKADAEAIQAALKKHVLGDADVAKARRGGIEKAVDDFFRPAGK